MKLAIAGIHIESSTFSPLKSGLGNFHATRGPGMLERYPFLAKEEFKGVQPLPLAHFRALPGGSVTREAYETMKEEILEGIHGPDFADAFYFDVHGAMSVEGLADAEADLLRAIREKIGTAMPVTCSQDLHGNVSDDLLEMADFITTYRTAPHVDWMETRERAVANLVRWWLDPKPVHRARVGIPVLVSGEMSSTETEPGKGLYAPLAGEAARPGVWDASLWVGYAWADQARSMASAVATGTDAHAVKQVAEEIARRYWEARAEFRFVAPAGNARWCLDEALRLTRKAVFLSDAGDNPTAGAAGDVPGTLNCLLEHPAFSGEEDADAIFASIPDAAAVAACFEAGTGGRATLSLGGKLDPVHGEPLAVTGTVIRLRDEDPAAGRQAVVQAGKVEIILTEKRKPFHLRNDFLALGLEPLERAVTVVKIGYLEPELKAMASHHLLVLSAGGVPPLLTDIPYRHLQRPVFPVDERFNWQPEARVFTSFAD